MCEVPAIRVRSLNDAEPLGDGDYVLYWMTAFRRVNANFSLQRAVEWSNRLGKPLLVLEALRCGYRWASDRLHQFVIQGMQDNAARLSPTPVRFYPYVEPAHGAGRGLLKHLAARACVVVSDDFPAFFLPKMFAAAARQIPVRFELVDSNGLLPMRAAEKTFARAYDFRRFLQKNLLQHLAEPPEVDPVASLHTPRLSTLPNSVEQRWPKADFDMLLQDNDGLGSLPIDHSVGPVETPGGSVAAERACRQFVQQKLDDYGQNRNQPELDAASGFSPYLHFGHLSAHHVFDAVASHDGWTPAEISGPSKGSSSGWWGASESVEAFLDELITWRELGYNMCWQRDDYDRYDSLPEWAQETLAEHATDSRDHVYSLKQFESAETHNELWNACQRQLLREGRIHNYLRMLWGKKILEWTESPRDALKVMIQLNNKFALDGRDPNSYSGIFWVLGRYDRPWGPQRPIFGKIRYMSCENTARKLRISGYLRKHAAEPDGQ